MNVTNTISKICFVAYGLDEKHGYGRVALDLIQELEKKGITGPILTFKNSPIPEHLQDRVRPILTHKPTSPLSRPFSLLRDNIAIRKAAKNCQGIHLLTESHLATSIFRFNKPFIVSTYGTWALRPLTANQISKQIFKKAYQRSKAVISISKETKNRLEEIIPEARHQVIHLGRNFSNGTSQNILSKPPVKILSVGALTSSKGFEVSTEAVTQLEKTINKEVQYAIVAGRVSQETKSQVQAIAKKNNFKNLHIAEKVSDEELKSYYQSADIFLLTPIEKRQDYEGFGLIFIEAMSYGLPIVSSNSGAIAEIIPHNQLSLLANEGDAEDTLNRLVQIITSKKKREEMLANYPEALKYYSTKRMSQEYLKLYTEVFA